MMVFLSRVYIPNLRLLARRFLSLTHRMCIDRLVFTVSTETIIGIKIAKLSRRGARGRLKFSGLSLEACDKGRRVLRGSSATLFDVLFTDHRSNPIPRI